MLAAIVWGFLYGYNTSENTIDLPEEHTLISRDRNNPDTLISFYTGNKLHVEFVPKKIAKQIK